MPLDPSRFGARSWSEWFGGKAIPLVFWSLLAFLAFRALGVSPEAPGPPGPEHWLGIARRALTLAFFLLIVWAYLIRSRLAAPALGFRERVFPMLVFFGGIAGVFALQVLDLPRRFDFGWSGLLVALPGLALSLWALLHLKRSFSILAEARQVVTTGPYTRCTWARP
jgi:protein-S-isoprenylcysteine O-methyltransferase Ste14